MNDFHPKILVIDDEPINLMLLGNTLKHDYDVQVATSGKVGLKLARETPPDLILLDIMMPGMDGHEVCRKMKADAALQDIPVIFITALTEADEEIAGLSLGAADYLTKPINIPIAKLRIRNILEREMMRKEILSRQEQQKLAASVFTHSQDSIIITNANNLIIDVNASFTRISGYRRDEVLGKNPRFLKSGKQDKSFYELMWNSLAEEGHWRGELWNKNKEGGLFAVEATISVIKDGEGNIDHFVGVFTDVTERKQHEKELERIAHFDELTGMPNRALLADRMNQAVAHARRAGNIMAVCYLDLDGFKPINDQYGHKTGDAALIEISSRIKKCLREVDTLSRVGGDEFVILLMDLTRPEEYKHSLLRILNAISEPMEIEGHSITLSGSLGVTLFPQDDSEPEMLMRHADQAMYIAKQNGKNRYYLFDSSQEKQAFEHGQMLMFIKRAIDNDEFVLFYQPKVNLATGEVIGAEALIRWQHPERGLLSPDKFLPMIEESDLMIELDNWVINTALQQMTDWQQTGLELVISVNIAPCHLVQQNFLFQLNRHFQQHPNISPNKLELEILETAALDNVSRVSKTMLECQSLGVSFALDDFGTGYSSLTYLKTLPAKILKIDQTFVRDMLSDPDDMAIINGTIGLAKAFGREVIAEGVETIEHGRQLLKMGCKHAQGYGIARPMPALEIRDWIEGWHERSGCFRE